jgi:acyl-CoA thioester hydrolase
MSESLDASTMRKLAEVPLALRWRDLDALNHVNNATYLTYLEEARLYWLSRLAADWNSDAARPLLVATHLNFRRQLRWPGEIVVQLFAERLGTTSLTLAYRIVDRGDGDIVYCDGNCVMLWSDAATGRPVPLPVVIRAACG